MNQHNDTPLLAARLAAAHKADETGLPQTVFRNEFTAGWWHTHPFSSTLRTSESFATVLPLRYFERPLKALELYEIAEKLRRIASGATYSDSVLRMARLWHEATKEEVHALDRYLEGCWLSTDHLLLQDLAIRMSQRCQHLLPAQREVVLTNQGRAGLIGSHWFKWWDEMNCFSQAALKSPVTWWRDKNEKAHVVD